MPLKEVPFVRRGGLAHGPGGANVVEVGHCGPRHSAPYLPGHLVYHHDVVAQYVGAALAFQPVKHLARLTLEHGGMRRRHRRQHQPARGAHERHLPAPRVEIPPALAPQRLAAGGIEGQDARVGRCVQRLGDADADKHTAAIQGRPRDRIRAFPQPFARSRLEGPQSAGHTIMHRRDLLVAVQPRFLMELHRGSGRLQRRLGRVEDTAVTAIRSDEPAGLYRVDAVADHGKRSLRLFHVRAAPGP